MKFSTVLLTAACALTAAAAANPPASPFSALPQVPPKEDAEKTVVRVSEESILDRSDILSDGTRWTLVPKGAVLHLPAKLAERVGDRPTGTLVGWHDFLAANRNWLAAEEISMDQAAGQAPLSADRPDTWEKQGKVVVAVHLAGPISVKPAPAAPATASK